MSQILEAYSEISVNCPELADEEIRDCIVQYIEAEIPKKIAKTEISTQHANFESFKKSKLRKRMKKKDRKSQIKKEKEKVDFLNSLLITKDVLEEDESLNTLTSISSELQNNMLGQFSHPHMFPSKLVDINFADKPFKLKNEFKSHNPKRKQHNIYDAVKITKKLSNGTRIKHELIYDKVYDKILNINVDLGAKETLNLWLSVIDELESDDDAKMINFNWKGDLDLPEAEFVDYAVKIMLKSGNGPKALEGFNAEEAVKEGRGY